MMTISTLIQIGLIGYNSMTYAINIFMLVSVILMYIAVRHCVTNRRLDSSAKALWTIVILLFPLLGAVAYLAGGRLTKQKKKDINEGSGTDELIKMAELLKSGILTQEEFEREKAKLLNS